MVDDEPINRALLVRLLAKEGHEVVEAGSGEEALTLVRDCSPDVILLDVMMPPPDGFQVCQQLKSDPETAAIPVLLVTSLADREARLRGIRDGANDFLTKPIDPTETLLRVRNAVRSKKLYDLSQVRYRRQVELESLKDNMMQAIVHDLKTPLTSMAGYARLLEESLGRRASEEERTYLRRVIANGDSLLEMISSVLDVARMESGDFALTRARVSLPDLLTEVEVLLGPLVPEDGRLTTSCPEALECDLDRELIRRVLCNLGENALRSLPLSGGLLNISVTSSGGCVRFSVQDNGRGIPADALDRIFDRFAQAAGGEKHTFGLGLSFCEMAIKAHGGKIEVESQLGSGTQFFFHLSNGS